MAGPVSLTVDPFAGGQITMDQATFSAAREMLQRPPNDPGNVAVHQDIYLAAMVVDLRARALAAVNAGGTPPRGFVCPVCRAPIDENQMHQSYECRPCGRGFTYTYIINKYFNPTQNAGLMNPPAFGPRPTTGISVPKIALVPRVPKLTSSVPKGAEVDMSRVKVDTATKTEPVIQYRSWIMDLTRPAEDWALQSVTYKEQSWPGMTPMHATHAKAKAVNQAALGCAESGSPSWHCNCGLYGVKTLRQAQEWGRSSPPSMQVIGKASFWGRLHHYENGLRSEYAYPWQLWIPDLDDVGGADHFAGATSVAVKNHLEKMYGVEVAIDSGMFNLGLSHS